MCISWSLGSLSFLLPVCGSLVGFFLPRAFKGGVGLASAITCWRCMTTDVEGGVPLASVQAPPGIVGEGSQELDPWSPRDSRTGIIELRRSFPGSQATPLVRVKGPGGRDRSWWEAPSLTAGSWVGWGRDRPAAGSWQGPRKLMSGPERPRKQLRTSEKALEEKG